MSDIIRWNENGEEKTREVRSADDVFRFPEAFPEAEKPGARIVTDTTVYYYDSHGTLNHHDNHPHTDWWDMH